MRRIAAFVMTALRDTTGVDEMHSDGSPDELKENAIDYVATSAKAILGAVPFAGSLLAEIAGSIIPKQRVDRIVDFAARLERRIATLEADGSRMGVLDEEFTDLTEEALRQASRATTSERREYLASLLANSLSPVAISFAESKHLMRMLGELNDVEVVWLRFYASQGLEGDQKFRKLHESVLEPRRAHFESSTREQEADALQKSYTAHLVRLGLVEEGIRRDKNGQPEFDRFTSTFKISHRRATTLGSLLLRQIGFPDPVDDEEH